MRSLSDSMSIVRVGFLDEARMVEPCSVVVIVGDAILSFSFLDGYVSDFSGVPNAVVELSSGWEASGNP